MSRQFFGLLRAQQNRELLWQIKRRLDAIVSEVATLRAEPLGAAWIHPRISRLTGASMGLPQPIINAVREAIRRDGTLCESALPPKKGASARRRQRK